MQFSAPWSSHSVLLQQSSMSTCLATTVVSNFSDNMPPSRSSPLNNPQSTLPFCEIFASVLQDPCFARPAHWPVSSPGYSPARESPGKLSQTRASPCQESFANFLSTRLVHKCHTGHRNNWQVWNLNILRLFCLLFIALWTEWAHQENRLQCHYSFCHLLRFNTSKPHTSSYSRNPTHPWRGEHCKSV